MVYARQIGDRTLTLHVSGKLWRNSLIMQDEETGSLWSHVTGEALEGPSQGERLETIPMVQSTWAEWKRAHPDTEVLRKEGDLESSRYESYFADPERTGIFRTLYNEERLPAKSRIFGLTDGPHALAVAETSLEANEPRNLMLNGKHIVLYRAPDGGVRAFAASVRGAPLRFEYSEKGRSVRDRETNSGWDLARGVCVTGRYRGQRLEELQVTRAFWFAWSSFYPNSEVSD